MAFIEPLALQTWFMSVFSGTPEIFIAVALIVIISMAGYFKMKMLTMFFMLGTFLLMFAGIITSPILILMLIIGGLVVGFSFAKFVER